MTPVYIHTDHPHGKHVVAWRSADGSTQHQVCHSARSAEMLAGILQRILDAVPMHDYQVACNGVLWAVRDEVVSLVEQLGRVTHRAEMYRVLLDGLVQEWDTAKCVGFVCGDQAALTRLLEVVEKIKLQQ